MNILKQILPKLVLDQNWSDASTAIWVLEYYSYDECYKEIMLNLIYLTKCIIDFTGYPRLNIASMEIRRRVLSRQYRRTFILQANTK